LSWIDGLSLGAPYGTSTLFNTLGIDASPDGNYVVAKNSGRFTVFSTSKAGLKPVNGTMDASTFLATFNTVDSSQIVFLNDSSRFFISDPADSMIFSFTMINGQPSSQSILSYNNSNSPSCMAASADSKYLFSCDISNDTLDVFSTDTGAVTSVANRIGGGILSSHLDLTSVVVSKDGKYVYVLGNRLTDNVASVVLVYSYDAGQISAVSSVFDVAGDPTALAISPDGNLLAVSTNSPNSIAIYQVDSGRLSWLQSIATDQQASDVKFSPNGRYLYAAVPGPDGSAQGSILSFTTLNSNATDTLSALLNLHSQPSIGAATLFRQLTPQPVFTPVPASAPSTVVIP
jgi:6-phosphogluconolactonase (cycloisomerase 2 family)